MKTKMIEIRDSATCIPSVAIQMVAHDAIEHAFLRRCGYPVDGSSIMLMRLSDGKATNDPYEWESLRLGGRTMPNAHNWIIDNWAAIESGQVVDVRVVLGETEAPATADIVRIVAGAQPPSVADEDSRTRPVSDSEVSTDERFLRVVK